GRRLHRGAAAHERACRPNSRDTPPPIRRPAPPTRGSIGCPLLYFRLLSSTCFRLPPRWRDRHENRAFELYPLGSGTQANRTARDLTTRTGRSGGHRSTPVGLPSGMDKPSPAADRAAARIRFIDP